MIPSVLTWLGDNIINISILVGMFFGWRELRSKDTTNERESMDLLNIRQATAMEQSRAEVSKLRLELFDSQMTNARKIADVTSSSETRLTTVENENRLLRQELTEARQEVKEAREELREARNQIETQGKQITTLIAQLEVAHNTTTVASPTPTPGKSASLQAPVGSTVSVKVEPDEK